MKLKWKIATAVSLVVIAASICHEPPHRKASRLKIEEAKIQTDTLQTILKNDLKIGRNLDEETLFFEMLRVDLQQCRTIEAKLREISPGEDLLALERNTTGIFELIAQREQQNNARIEFSRKQEEAERIDWDKVPPWEPGAAGPPGTNRPAARSESKQEGEGRLSPDIRETP